METFNFRFQNRLVTWKYERLADLVDDIQFATKVICHDPEFIKVFECPVMIVTSFAWLVEKGKRKSQKFFAQMFNSFR